MKKLLGCCAAALALGAAVVAGSSMALARHPGHEEVVSDGDLTKNRQLLHHGGQGHDPNLSDGHIPKNVNYGFSVVANNTLGGEETGRYTDVWGHKGYAYVGTFHEPTCDRSGVYITDIRDPADPQVVNMIKSPPDTRVNDVKVHTVGDREVLIFSLEKCGPFIATDPNAPDNVSIGQGGISLWDVTDPANPHALMQNFLDFQVHNTFAWTTASRNSYLLVVDDEHINDTHIVDITKPQIPRLISTTGIGDWLDDPDNPVADDGQLFTGVFSAPLLHDIWVEDLDTGPGENWVAVLSYWDAGFITLDVNDPANPQFIGDSTYPNPDPVLGTSPAEGNAHAAVFGGEDFGLIYGGDEDFDALAVSVKPLDNNGNVVGRFFPTQGSDVPLIGSDAFPTVSGPTVFVGQACTAGSVPLAMMGDIALIERGSCAFTTKAQNVQVAGYATGIVFNQPSRNDGQSCEVSISMLVVADIPMLFLPRSAGFAILDIANYDPAMCSDDPAIGDGDNPPLPEIGVAGLDVDISATFDGWGYFHVLNNNQDSDLAVPAPPNPDRPKKKKRGKVTVPYLGEAGYYAPAELTDPELAVGSGDLTMHNVVAGLQTQDVTPSFEAGPRAFISWYALGMRAVEFRPGHFHDNSKGEGVFAWNVHEVGRFIADDGSNFWGVHVTEIDGVQYILGSDRDSGLWIFTFECDVQAGPDDPLYCTPL